MCGGCANGAWHFFNIVNSKALLPHMQTGAHWHALSPEPACPGKIRSRKTAVGTTVTAFAPREPCLSVCSVLTATTTAIKMEENSSRWAFVHFPVLWHFHRFSAFPPFPRRHATCLHIQIFPREKPLHFPFPRPFSIGFVSQNIPATGTSLPRISNHQFQLNLFGAATKLL